MSGICYNKTQCLVPFPMIQSLILLAQYSLVHHSSSLLLVSRPTAPPSASASLVAELSEGDGDGFLEGAKLLLREADVGKSSPLVSFNKPRAFKSFAAFDKLSR